jgi:MFS family permease
MNDVNQEKLRGIAWLSAFLITGAIAAGFVMQQVEELLTDLIGGFWDELRTDFLGYLLSYTWGVGTFVVFVFNLLLLFLIVLIPLLLFQRFLKKNRQFDFFASTSWMNWCKALFVLSVSSLVLYLLAFWQTWRAVVAGESLSLSGSQWEVVYVVFANLWVISLFWAGFMASAIRTPRGTEKTKIKAGVYGFAVISVFAFALGPTFESTVPTEEEMFQQFSFLRVTQGRANYANLCATWATAKDAKASVDLFGDPTTVVEQNLAVISVLDLILLENLYWMQLNDPTWTFPYVLHGRMRAFVNGENIKKVLPKDEADRFLADVQELDIETSGDLVPPFVQYMTGRCP